MPIKFTLLPFAFDCVLVNKCELTVSTGFAKFPVSFVLGTILPDMHTVPMLMNTKPLAYILRFVWEVCLGSFFQL